jgi:thiamine-phosphate pyrophosphorylase
MESRHSADKPPCGQTLPDSERSQAYRILDANLNRLREALRVVEEHVRFVRSDGDLSITTKRIRHSLESMVTSFGPKDLLANRDTGADPFASVSQPEELSRAGIGGVLAANLKRAQEAARVIEEYAKVVDRMDSSETAKAVRFSLYDLEKRLSG